MFCNTLKLKTAQLTIGIDHRTFALNTENYCTKEILENNCKNYEVGQQN